MVNTIGNIYCCKNFCQTFVNCQTFTGFNKTVRQPIGLVRQLTCWQWTYQKFILPTLWPPNSLNLNPVNYNVWSVMQKKVYRKRIKDIHWLTHTHGTHLSQSVWSSLVYFDNALFKVWLVRSSWPLVWGWYAEVINCFTPKDLKMNSFSLAKTQETYVMLASITAWKLRLT